MIFIPVSGPLITEPTQITIEGSGVKIQNGHNFIKLIIILESTNRNECNRWYLLLHIKVDLVTNTKYLII